MQKLYMVELTEDEREELKSLVRQGRSLARNIQHAQILLKADSGARSPGWPDERIARSMSACARLKGFASDWWSIG